MQLIFIDLDRGHSEVPSVSWNSAQPGELIAIWDSGYPVPIRTCNEYGDPDLVLPAGRLLIEGQWSANRVWAARIWLPASWLTVGDLRRLARRSSLYACWRDADGSQIAVDLAPWAITSQAELFYHAGSTTRKERPATLMPDLEFRFVIGHGYIVKIDLGARLLRRLEQYPLAKREDSR